LDVTDMWGSHADLTTKPPVSNVEKRGDGRTQIREERKKLKATAELEPPRFSRERTRKASQSREAPHPVVLRKNRNPPTDRGAGTMGK